MDFKGENISCSSGNVGGNVSITSTGNGIIVSPSPIIGTGTIELVADLQY
jgi:hypothetical protein